MRVMIDQQFLRITSVITQEDIEAAFTFAPNSLKAKDEKGNHLYAVTVGDHPEIKENYIQFNGKNQEGNLTCSLVIPMIEDTEERLSTIKSTFGKQLANLQKFESVIKDQIAAATSVIDDVFTNVEMR